MRRAIPALGESHRVSRLQEAMTYPIRMGAKRGECPPPHTTRSAKLSPGALP
jgi:hypothetical protein